MVEQYFHRGYHQIRQGTVYTKRHVRQSKLLAKQYWGTDIYLVPKILGHSYLVLKILGHSYLEQNNIGAQLFSAKNTEAQLFSAKNTGAQLFRPKQY